MFENDDVKVLVERAGEALLDEHKRLLECASKWRKRTKPHGIRNNVNERYYQFVIWRDLMSSFRFRPETERGGHDLAFYDDETNTLVAVAEMKGWWSSSGDPEIPGIKRDVNEKLKILAIPGVMLIFTDHSNVKAKQEENLQYLAKALEVDRNSFITHAFESDPFPGYDQEGSEFMVIGFLVKPNVPGTSA